MRIVSEHARRDLARIRRQEMAQREAQIARAAKTSTLLEDTDHA
jgi:hypothetical protein